MKVKKSFLLKIERILKKPRLPIHLNFIRWVLIDFFRGKVYRLWGIYMFVAKPGNGKTLSMVAHMERVKKERPHINIYTNFNYKGQTGEIKTWKDIVSASDNSIIAIDEIHMSFGSMNYTDFPVEMLGEITQNRHSGKQFICSTQNYDMVNINFKRLCNYIVLCKNVWGLDRLFNNYYFDRGTYENGAFVGKKAKAEFLRAYVADDDLYSKYDTLEKISSMISDIENKNVDEVCTTIDSLLSQSCLADKELRYLKSIKTRINEEKISVQKVENLQKQNEKLRDIIRQLQLEISA